MWFMGWGNKVSLVLAHLVTVQATSRSANTLAANNWSICIAGVTHQKVKRPKNSLNEKKMAVQLFASLFDPHSAVYGDVGIAAHEALYSSAGLI
jgi:hypothetical protein